MSQETLNWLNNNTLVGFTNKRGKAWHYDENEQRGENNHYPEAVPTADVVRRLFHWRIGEALVINGKTLDAADGYKLVYREDTGAPFGVFSDGYVVHQYPEWLIDNVANILDVSSGELGIGSAGLLMGGAVAWVQIERPESVRVAGDELRPFILATTSANGRYATSYKRGTTRVVCDNTLAEFHSKREGAKGFFVKHTKGSTKKLDQARRLLEITFDHQAAELQELERLMNAKVDDAAFWRIVDKLDPVDGKENKALTIVQNKRGILQTLWESNPMVAPYKGTAYGVVQAYNTYNHNFGRMRSTGDAGSRGERNMLNFLSGKTAEDDGKVLKVLASI